MYVFLERMDEKKWNVEWKNKKSTAGEWSTPMYAQCYRLYGWAAGWRA